MLVRYLICPEVVADVERAASEQMLSDVAIEQLEIFARSDVLTGISYIFTSEWHGARQAGSVLAEHLTVRPVADPDMNECETMVIAPLPKRGVLDRIGQVFAKPLSGQLEGRETAQDAQDRIAAAYHLAMEQVIARGMRGDVLFVGHGRIGALLQCHLTGQSIGSQADAPLPGHHFAYDWGARKMLHGWRPMHELTTAMFAMPNDG
ncbi:histidine phosphatase family protein [Cohaesibacter haloalkalitolerans]|uniref:histidine phosphatase family protein n=1 Tax=Cohaesibacter haloalkalitolerans TaxID=1162980 RepID=UPI000E64889E|nr:histidine phosphatase family protein [Cohaesibacter haloalkalitolerans]